MQKRLFAGAKGNRLSIPSSVTITISPGFTSRTKRAPMMSSAQVSEARIVAPSMSPMTSGRTPSTSRQPIIFLVDRQTSDQAPSILCRASTMRSTSSVRLDVAMRCEDHLGVGGRLEDRATALELVLQGQRIGQVAVVGDGEAAAGELGEQRLDVVLDRAAMGRIAVVADGAVARQALHDARIGEGIADQTDMTLGMEAGAVEGNDARRLLAAMLERVQPEHGQRRGIGVTEDAKNTALLAQLVVVERLRRQLVHCPRFPRRQFPPFSISRLSCCREESLGPELVSPAAGAASGGDASGTWLGSPPVLPRLPKSFFTCASRSCGSASINWLPRDSNIGLLLACAIQPGVVWASHRKNACATTMSSSPRAAP